MPIYKTKSGKAYDIPENMVAEFENDIPDAIVEMYNDDGEKYDVPLDKREKFQKKFNGWSYDGKKKDDLAAKDSLISEGLKDLDNEAKQLGVAKVASIAGVNGATERVVADTISKTKTEKDDVVSKVPELRGGWNATEQEKKQLLAGMQASKVRLANTVDDFNKGVDNLIDYGKKSRATLSNGVVDAGVRVNADTGRAEKMYMSPDGKRFADKEMAEYATKLFKRSADVSVAGQLRRAKERLSYLQSLRSGRGDELDTKQGLGEKIGTSVLSITGGATGVVRDFVGRRLADNEWARLNTAINETEEQIRVLEEEYKRLNGDEDNFVESLGKTLIAPRTWAFGVPELMDNAVKLSSDNSNSDREEKATMLLMESTLGKEEAHRLYDKNMSNWRKWGAITGQAVPFMLDFALTSGVTSGIRAGAKTAGKVATKVVGKEVAEQIAKNGIKAYAKSNGVKGALQAGTDWTIKAFGATADEFARGFVVANTVQGAKTASDAIDRKLGGVVVGEDGGLKFANDKSWGDAIWQAEANATIENMSEMAGGRLDKLIPNLPKTKVVSKIADVFGLKRISNVINGANYAALKNVSNMMRGAFAKMGIHDITGEISEEYYGQLWRTAFALDDAYAYDENGNKVNLFKTGEFHKDIWGGMSLTVGVMKAVQGGVTGAQYMSIKHGVNKADKRASTLLGADTWGAMRFQFENATNEQMGDLVEAVLKDKKLNDDERGAVMDYATNYMVLRGANTATYKQVDAEAVTKDIQEVQEAYNNGRGIKSDEEMQNANSVYRMLQGRIDSEIGVGVADEIEADPLSVLHRYKGTDKEDLVRDYITSKSVYDGIIDRVQEDIELKNVEAEAKVDARTNKSNGLVQSVKLSSRDSDGNDRIVYVKDGNLVVGDDGQIDREKSDSAFVVFDEVSGKSEMMSLSDFIGVNEVLNADEAKRVATESITNEYAQLMADRIDGVLSFNAGEIYKGIDDNGSEVVVEVVNDNGDGTVSVIVGNDNKTVTVKKEDVQRWSNNVIAERVKRFDEEGKNDNRFFGFGLNNGKYRLDDKVQLRRNNELVEGRIVSPKNEDGMYQVEIGDPLEGGRVVLLSEQEIEGMNNEVEELQDSNTQNGVTKVEPKVEEVEELAQQEGNDPVVKKEDIPATEGGVTALERIPKSELGEPMYEQVDAEIAWDAIVEQTEGDVELAMEVVKGMIANKEERLKKVEKTKPKVGETVTQKIKAVKEHKAIIEKARYDVEAWKNIGAVLARRTAETEREKSVAEETLQPNDVAGQEVRQDVVVPQEEVVTSAEEDIVNTEKEQTEVARQVESRNDDVYKEQTLLMGSGVESGVSLSQAEIDELLDKMEKGATERPKIELNPKSWNEQFGNNGIVSTPIGDVKMGENQIAKLFEKGRSEQFGMIKPTLETPQIVVEVPSQDAKGNTERASSYLFVKTFIDDKGAKVYYFKSVTVKKDGLEVSVSSHLDRQKRVLESLKKGKLLYRFDGGAQTEHLPADVSVTTSHEVMQGNYDNKVSENYGNEQTLLIDSGVESGVLLSEQEIDELLDKMEKGAETAREIDLTPDNWLADFGIKGFVSTPIGDVKMGDNQLAKMFLKNRLSEFSMVKPTLVNPDVILEEKSASNGGSEERKSSYVFIKTFDKGGKKIKFYASITVKKEGLEVSVSSHYINKTAVVKKILSGEVIYIKEALLSNSSDWHLAEHQKDVPDLLPTQESNALSLDKVSESSDNEQTLQEKIDDAEKQTNTNPTDAQKKAGNYKKGRVNVGSFEIVIEQPKGSVRSGVDGNGKKWSTVMNNTYGYFAETKGVDGDNIDVFLTNDVDYWDGRRIYVVDQYNEDGSFDEHKVMLGYNDEVDAKADYLKNYNEDWEKKRKIVVSSVNVSEFEKWLASSNRKIKPFAEYKNVGKDGVANSNKNADVIDAESNKKGVISQSNKDNTKNRVNNGQTGQGLQAERVGRDNDEQRKDDSARVANDATGALERVSHGGNIRVFEEGLATPHNAYSKHSERDRRNAESERLVGVAKEYGLFVPIRETKTFGEKYNKRTGESIVYINEEAGKVIKIKDPYAKSALKTGVQPEDAIFEHLVHNLLFTNTAYTLEGVSEEVEEVRVILSQDFISTYNQPTSEQIENELKRIGLEREDRYSFGNEFVSVTDVMGDNVLLGDDGTLFFIDPIIRFKKPLREVISALEKRKSEAESEDNILYRRGDKDVSSYDNELKQIKSEAIANGNFMLAPNGKPTRLNERQWLQVRTKAFKDWFGDWELRHKAVNVVRASKKFKDFSSDKSWANKNIAKVYSNEETGGKGNIEISKTSISKYFNSSSVEKSSNAEVHKSVVSVLPDIIKHSVVGEIHPDYIKVNGVRAKKNGIVSNSEIHRLYGAVEMEGNVYRVKTTVKYFTDDNINNKAHTYEVIKIELLNEFSSSELEQDSQTVSPIQTTNLLQGVEKTYEKGKYILDDYSKVVDDNGEPLVVYHGTPEKLGYVFEYGKSFYGGNLGFWFTNSKEAAKDYSFNEEKGEYVDIKAVFLNARDIMDFVPLSRNTTTKRFNDYVKEHYDIYMGRGSSKELPVNEIYQKNASILYPGVHDAIKLADVGHTYIVKRPNQIKSATDNVGSFDDADEDIRFRIGDVKRIGRNGRKIEFTKVNPTVTMNALAKWLDKSKVEHSYRTAKTGSRYISFEREGVTFSVRGANHTSDGTFSGYNEGIYVSVDESTGKVYDVEVDLSVNDYGIDDLRTIISDIVAYNDGSKSVEDLHEDVAVYFEDRNKGLNIDEATLRKRREDYNADLKQFYAEIWELRVRGSEKRLST